MSAFAINSEEDRQIAQQLILDLASQCILAVLAIVHKLKQLNVQPALIYVQKLGLDAAQVPNCANMPSLEKSNNLGHAYLTHQQG